MKNSIEIEEEVVARLENGKSIQGSVRRDLTTGSIIFKAHNIKPRKRYRDKIIRYLEHGWVKESIERIKVFESLPKNIGTTRIIDALDRENQEVASALTDREIV